MFFKPEFVDAKWRMPIDEIVDNSIQNSPIDCRRRLYQNVVISGGSTLIKHFKERLQKQIQKRVNDRLRKYKEASGFTPKPIDVSITENPFKYFSVWHGASKFSSNPGFQRLYHTKA